MRTVGWLALLLVPSWAFAGTPTKVARKFDVGTAQVKRLMVAADEGLVVGVSGDGKVVAVDTEQWIADSASPCDALSAVVDAQADGSGYLVWVGCEDGWVRELRWDGDALAVSRDDAGDGRQWQIAKNPLVALWLGGDGRLYGLAEATGEGLRLHDLDTDSGDIDQNDGPLEFFERNYKEGHILGNTGGNIGTLYLSHGGEDFSQTPLSLGPITSTLPGAVSLQVSDVTLGPISSGVSSGLYIADPQRGLVQWSGALGTGSLQPFNFLDASLDGLHSLVVTYDRTRATPEAIVAEVQGDIQSFVSAGVPTGVTFSAEADLVDMVEGPYGYVLGGTKGGKLNVYTAAPWLKGLVVDPVEVETGDTVTVSFNTDSAGTWRILLGGTRSGDGDEIAEGNASAAGDVSIDLVVDDSWEEGAQSLWVFQTSSAAETGHVRGAVSLDNPPLQVDLREGNVGFADEALVLEYAALSASDLTEYVVYLSTTPFTADDWPVGGPESTIEEGVKSPRRLDVDDDESLVKVRIGGLENYVSYYIAVRAIDADGTEGPMSNVVEGMPRPTRTSAEFLGEGGGSGCATAGGGAVAGLLTLLALRRRRGLAVAAALVALAPATGQAQEEPRRGLARFDHDMTPSWASFEVRHDFQQLQQDALRAAYNPWVSVLRLEAGPQIFRVFELDFGLGFMTRKGFQVDDNLDRSADAARMQWMPLSLGATGRVHIIDEQPIVPYVGAGIDWVFYREDALDTEGAAIKSSRLVGSKQGWHWQVGGNILLDLFSPSRASRLEAITGINDTWLTIEYRDQTISPGDGAFDFSGWALSIGLKLDY
jgi:hypothetical protein